MANIPHPITAKLIRVTLCIRLSDLSSIACVINGNLSLERQQVQSHIQRHRQSRQMLCGHRRRLIAFLKFVKGDLFIVNTEYFEHRDGCLDHGRWTTKIIFDVARVLVTRKVFA